MLFLFSIISVSFHPKTNYMLISYRFFIWLSLDISLGLYKIESKYSPSEKRIRVYYSWLGEVQYLI